MKASSQDSHADTGASQRVNSIPSVVALGNSFEKDSCLLFLSHGAKSITLEMEPHFVAGTKGCGRQATYIRRDSGL